MTDLAPGDEKQLDVPPYRYTAALADQIETTWQDRWEKDGTFHAPNPIGDLSAGFEKVAGRPKLFALDMFPYPSGTGLHVGHPLGYIGTDVYARYMRMRGYNVLHAMGFDAFGLPAEQYAVQTGQHPRVTTEANVANMRRQLRRLGLGHDSRRSVVTTDPGYYRWTQWIFLQIYNSWYDRDAAGVDGRSAGKARGIDELIDELDRGVRSPGEGTNPFGGSWSALSDVEKRVVVDNHRLAFLSEAPVNWCPGLGTVLANEEVTADGRSERGNFPVFRRPLKQWMLRITAYADRLIDDLDLLDWTDQIKLMQRNWIGRSEGAQVVFPVAGAAAGGSGAADSGAADSGAAGAAGPAIEVFTTRPDTLFGATYMVLAPEHPLVDTQTASAWPEGTKDVWTGGFASPAEAVSAYRTQASRHSDVERQVESRDKTGVFTGSFAVNPTTGAEIPVFVADYVLMGYGTGAIMAVPAQDERDWAFAQRFDLPIVRTVQPPSDWSGEAFVGDGPAINSANDEISLDGLGVADAKRTIIDWLEGRGAGRRTITYKLRDWLFSRQRYWGEPFPIVYDPDDGLPRAVPDVLLPIQLPEVDDYSPTTFADDDTSAPEPPLARATDWVEVDLDLGEGVKRYRRETNTMPQWAGSCWYELRYLDPNDTQALVDPVNEKYWMGPRESVAGDPGGVDLYVGGVEHAVLHLLYARFWQKVLYDLGHVTSVEPYRRLFNQGYIQAAAYTDERGFYVEASEVSTQDGGFFHDGAPVRREYGKMGKSLKNSVTPDEMYEAYGADTLRLYEMSTGPLDQSRPWETRDVVGVFRLLQRIWRNVIDETTGDLVVSGEEPDDDTLRVVARTIAGVSEAMQSIRFNVAIARITELNNFLTGHCSGAGGGVPEEVAEILVLLLAPLAPHAAEELWSRLGHEESLVREAFPEPDPVYLIENTVEVPVQINGKVRSRLEVAVGLSREDLEAAARADAKVAALLDGATVRKVVAVPDRLVNFVVG
jgi:leucyl-tRNA synthetase